MCGSEESLFRTKIEGSELKVCNKCSKYGKVLGPVKIEIEEKKVQMIEKAVVEEEPEVVEMIVPDFNIIIREKREKLGLNQEEFAKKINEKASIVHKMERGEFKPSLEMAKRLEHLLGVKLIEEYEEEHSKIQAGESKGLTIGDLIKFKKR